MEGKVSKELAALDSFTVTALETFKSKSNIVADRVSQVARGMANGTYIYGPPGTGKSHTALTKLRDLGVDHHYNNGHLTPKALFELLDDHSGETIVLDDVNSLFGSPQSLNILLAALGVQPGGERLICYDTAYDKRTAYFTGGIIVLSNLKLRDAPVQQALLSRVQAFEFDPTPEELEAFLRYFLETGYAPLDLSGEECSTVLDHILVECDRFSCRLDFRLVLDKGLKDFADWKSEDTETHWRDLISSSIKQNADTIQHSLASLGRADRVAKEVQIAGKIDAEFSDRPSKAKAWKAKTGKSERAFYRRLKGLA